MIRAMPDLEPAVTNRRRAVPGPEVLGLLEAHGELGTNLFGAVLDAGRYVLD
jgi:hypothetical protein